MAEADRSRPRRDRLAEPADSIQGRLAALEAAVADGLEATRPRAGAGVFALALLLLLIAIPLTIAATPPVDARLEARELTLVDRDGQARIRMRVSDAGHPELVFLGRDGARRVVLAAGADEVTFTLRGRDGQSRLGCAVDAADEPHILLSDADARPRMHAVVDTHGHGNLITFGDDGTVAAGFGIDDAGAAWIRPAAASTEEKR